MKEKPALRQTGRETKDRWGSHNCRLFQVGYTDSGSGQCNSADDQGHAHGKMPLSGPNGSQPVAGNVLFVLDTLNLGGTENQAVQAALRLKTSGYQVTVGCLHRGGPLADDLRKAGIQVVEFPTRGSLLSLYGAYQLLHLAWFVHRKKFDVVHAHDLWANLMGVPAARLAGARVIISSQRDLAHLWWYTPFRTKVIRLIHRLSTRVVVNSAAVHKHLVTRFRISPDRISIIRNRVDFERFAFARGDRRKIFPGLDSAHPLVAVIANMHSPVKGHHDLIEAARIVCKALPQSRFVLVGDGRERPNIEEHVREAELQANFLFLGYRNDVPALLSCCDLSVLASIAEGFPNAVLESMAAGLPVVATRVGGTAEIVEDGVSGLLVPPQDPAALAGAIRRLLSDRKLSRRLARSGQERVRRHFSFRQLLAQLERLYGRT